MLLDHVIVQSMDTDSAGGGDLESILTYGAKAIFEDDNTTDVTCQYYGSPFSSITLISFQTRKTTSNNSLSS